MKHTVSIQIECRDPQRVDSALAAVAAELERARAKFPGPNVTFAALVEEVGELSTALFSEGSGPVREEAIQVAVMALRIILDGDATFAEWRRSKGLDPLADHADC